MSESRILKQLAEQPTSDERIVARMSERNARFANETELAKAITREKRAAAGNSFGNVDPLLREIGGAFDAFIVRARGELGIPTPTLADHLARLEANGPWLEDLDVPDSRTWDIEPVDGGRFVQVHHELRLMSISFGSEAGARKDPMRRDEGALRRMRQRYEAHYPAPAETPEP